MNTIYYKSSSGTCVTVNMESSGFHFIRGAYEALMTPPPVKENIVNSSRLEDGSHVVTSMKSAQRDITLSIFISGSSKDDYLTKVGTLMAILKSGEFALRCPGIEKTNTPVYYLLVYKECSKYGDYGVKSGKFTLKLTEYDPASRTKPSWVS